MPKTIRDLWGKIVNILDVGGELAKYLPTYEYRQCQREMAEAVFKTFLEESIAIIEAGTGTGKTLAYLIPSVFYSLSYKEPVVVSTKTINLQEQIIRKDIPLLQEVMEEHFSAVLVKGWGNFICHRRIRSLEASDEDFTLEEYNFFSKLREWIKNTQTGDISDITFEVVESVWEKVCCEYSACPRAKCPFFGKCFFFENRRKMDGANILVTNHALLFTHVAMKRRSIEGESPIFPKFQRLILDEAHHIEEVASDFLGDDVTSTEFEKILLSLYNRQGRKDESGILVRMRTHKFSPALKSQVNNLIDTYCIPQITTLKEVADTLFLELITICRSKDPAHGESDRIRITQDWKKKNPRYLQESVDSFIANLSNYASQIEKLRQITLAESADNFSPELQGIIYKIKQYLESFLRIWNMEDENFVYVLEYSQKPAFDFVRLKSYPLVVADILHEELFKPMKTSILTSATLSINRNFSYIQEQLGLSKFDKDFVTTKIYDSPFDFQKQAIMAIPNDVPPYDNANFLPIVVPHLANLIRIMEGRTFILFTSYKMLNECAEMLRSKLEKEGFNILKQGDIARHLLLDKFKTAEKSVLLGTDSFWEGVDVPGRSLECVVMAKLPFRVPTDPILKARTEYIEKLGKNSFLHYSVPQAIIKFKQGFGRLIRNRKDRGVIISLDRRIIDKGYGKTFLSSLPKLKILKSSFAKILSYIEKWQRANVEAE